MPSPSESRDTTSDETEVTSKQQNDEVRSATAMGEQLARQSSIYSLTLDEIQNTVCVPGKPFGSMNMDEFLTNIWSAEEANAAADSSAPTPPPLIRQASLTLPPPLSGKTVDEVWAEIHREQSHQIQRHHTRHHHHQQQQQPFLPQQHQPRCADAAAAEPPNFGEMTLEDFLIKAGVVKEDSAAATPPPYGYQIGAVPEAAGYGAHAMGVGYGGGEHAPPAAVNGYAITNGKSAAAAAGYGGGKICFGGGGTRIGNGYGSSTSPVSEDGQVDNAAGPYGVGLMGGGGGGGGRKRGAEEAPVEKVVERRQRRMIKNRESAARSRARKQAYTVELEAELNQLKEENARLKAEENRILALRKQMISQAMSDRARANAAKIVRKLRRCNSMPL